MLNDRAILLLALGETLVWAGLFYVFPAMLLHWEADLGWSKSQLTLAITLAVFASAFAAPFAGRLIDAGFGAAQIGLSAAIGGVALIGVSMVSAVWQFYALWVLIGVCLAGCLYEPCFAMVTRARGAEAKRAIIAITLAAGFAGSISFPTVHVLTEAFGWRQALVGIGGFVVVVVAPILWLGAAALGPVDAEPTVAGERPKVFYSKVYWLLGIAFALVGLAHGATLHHLLPMLAERGVSADTAVLFASMIGPMQVAGRLCMVAVQSRMSSHAISLAAFVFIGGALVALFLAGANPLLLGIFVILFGGAYGTISILRPVIARDVLGGQGFGAKSGGLALMYLCASASSAYVGSLLWGVGGYGLMLGALCLCVAAGAVCYIAVRRIA